MEEKPDDQNDLFLSFFPDERTFKPDKTIEGVAACDGLQTQTTHEQVLATGLPHHWMNQNRDQCIELNVHGFDQYEKVVENTLRKLEEPVQLQEQ